MLRDFATTSHKRNLKIYLVGGFLRDLLVGKKSIDMDLTGSPGTLDFATEFARTHKLSAHFVRKHKLLRLTLSGLRLDITEYTGTDITEDLALRDFTVNALALPLIDYLEESDTLAELLDPFAGRSDLQQKTLRALPGALQSDPLRILRGARIALQLGLSPDPATVRTAQITAESLQRIPGERIMAEIVSVLQGTSVGYLPLLEALGVTQHLFGRPFAGKVDLVMQQTERLLCAKQWPTPQWLLLQKNLNRRLTVQTQGRDMLKLAALLCDVDGIMTGITPDTLQHILKLPLAREEKTTISAIAEALRWLQKSRNRLNDYFLYSYYSNYGASGLDATVLLRAVDGHSAYSLGTALLQRMSTVDDILFSPPQFMSGHEIAAMVGKRQQPSYQIGQLQRMLHRASALGDVSNRAEANAFAQGFLTMCEKKCRKITELAGKGTIGANIVSSIE